MKKTLTAFTLALISYIPFTHADSGKIMITGPAAFMEQEVNGDLDITGPFEFKDIKVKGHTKITGPVRSSNGGKFEHLNIMGAANLNEVKCEQLTITGAFKGRKVDVSEDTEVWGSFDATDSEFNKIKTSASEVRLKDVKADTLMLTGSKSMRKQKVILEGNTHISGDIVFEKGEGVVVTHGNDVNISGHVKNGKINKH